MSTIKKIRTQLGLTQTAFGAGIGCTQANVGHYENGQSVPPAMAARIIGFAALHGLALTYNDIYSPVTSLVIWPELAQAPAQQPTTQGA